MFTYGAASAAKLEFSGHLLRSQTKSLFSFLFVFMITYRSSEKKDSENPGEKKAACSLLDGNYMVIAQSVSRLVPFF